MSVYNIIEGVAEQKLGVSCSSNSTNNLTSKKHNIMAEGFRFIYLAFRFS